MKLKSRMTPEEFNKLEEGIKYEMYIEFYERW